MADNDLRLLLGDGALIQMTFYGRHRDAAEVIDITPFAEEFVNAGIRLPRAVAAPNEVTGFIEVDLGRGGRATWHGGGGDIDEGDVAHAIAAALELVDGEERTAMFNRVDERIRRRRLAELEQLLKSTGLTARQVGALLGRRRTRLGGKSIRTFMLDSDVGRASLAAAYGAVVEAVADRGLLDRLLEVTGHADSAAPYRGRSRSSRGRAGGAGASPAQG